MRLLAGMLLLLSLHLGAAELVLELKAGALTLDSKSLLDHPQARDILIPLDVSYERPMRYRAVRMAEVLRGVAPSEHLQIRSSDGFTAELPAAPLLQSEGAQAWLAVEDPANPWPPLGPGRPSAGPFYLVWQNPAAGNIGPEQWPFQIARVRQIAALQERFPALLPSAAASAEVQAGFFQFQKNCLACHRFNGAGDSAFGPDLNIPHSPTEYLAGDFLRRYIRDPQSMRRWPDGRMTGFSNAALSDLELDQLIAYLRHMAGRRQKF